MYAKIRNGFRALIVMSVALLGWSVDAEDTIEFYHPNYGNLHITENAPLRTYVEKRMNLTDFAKPAESFQPTEDLQQELNCFGEREKYTLHESKLPKGEIPSNREIWWITGDRDRATTVIYIKRHLFTGKLPTRSYDLAEQFYAKYGEAVPRWSGFQEGNRVFLCRLEFDENGDEGAQRMFLVVRELTWDLSRIRDRERRERVAVESKQDAVNKLLE